MTDIEIIKALKCCIMWDCYNCGWLRNDIRGELSCRTDLMRLSFDLIARQQAEIDSLRADLKRVCAERDAHICTSNFIKSEAIKEFAEKLKEKAITYYAIRGRWVSVKDIDELLKEMVGEV